MKKLITLSLVNLLLSLFINAQTNVASADRALLNNCMAPFYHGVASGDPLSDRVILWTRITPSTVNSDTIYVKWRIATDTAMTNIVNSGNTKTTQLRDYTVKVDATGLQPDKFYYYDFNALGKNSIRGRTKTAPVGDIDSLRFAVMSCSRYEEGYFNAYKKIVDRNDIDAVLFLGDYIYEEEYDSFSPDRDSAKTEPTKINEYRQKYSMYRLDADLMRAHQQYPWICVWDDHESANDAWLSGAENHDEGPEGIWEFRKKYATRAYQEWMPIRLPNASDSTIIYRKQPYGNLLNLYMLDTRLEGRSEQVNTLNFIALNDASRRMISQTQYSWLVNNMKNSTARWNIIGQQVMMAPLKVAGFPVNKDQWDDYPVQRKQLYDDIINNNIKNVVVLTGDIHTSWANDLPHTNYNSNTGAGSAGVEFVTPSVTSKGLPLGAAADIIKVGNGHIKYADVTEHGYIILDVNKQRAQADWYYVESVTDHSNNETHAAAYYVNNNERFLREGNASASSFNTSTPYAPECPLNSVSTSIDKNQDINFALLGSYPNPFFENLLIQLYNRNTDNVFVQLTDINGKIVFQQNYTELQKGLVELQINTDKLSKGIYNLTVLSNTEIKNRKLVKL